MLARQEKGFALVEASLVTAFLSSMLMSGLFVAYLSFARVWLARSAYESAICLATEATIHDCRIKLQQQTQTALPLGKVDELRLLRTRNEARIHLVFKVSGRIVLRIEERRSLLRGFP